VNRGKPILLIFFFNGSTAHHERPPEDKTITTFSAWQYVEKHNTREMGWTIHRVRTNMMCIQIMCCRKTSVNISEA